MTRLAYLSFLFLASSSLVYSAGTQFITGPCANDAACASGCCGFKSGLCAGPIIALTRDGGCGHGDSAPNANAANALGQGTFTVAGAATAPAAATSAPAAAAAGSAGGTSSSAPGAANVGNGAGKQFITGQCLSDSDCASGCCAFKTGKCAGAIIALTRDGGCGFGSGTPNANAANKLGQGTFTAPAGTGAAATAAGAAPAPAPAPTTPPTGSSSGTTSSPNKGVNNGVGAQFITGPCASDKDCASACCGFNTGKCAGPVIAQQRDGGCGFGNAVPNDTAAKALTGAAKRGVWDD